MFVIWKGEKIKTMKLISDYEIEHCKDIEPELMERNSIY